MTMSWLVLVALGIAFAADGDAGKDAAVALARKTLAARLQVSVDALQLDKAEAVNWPDTSLGCPEKGMMYAQVITPGYRVVLKHAGKPHAVHVSGTRAVTCGAEARKPARTEPPKD
jgi:hypothetical protein